MRDTLMRFIIFFVLALLAGCSTIQTYDQLAQPTGQVLTTHVGGQILHIKRWADLPNAFGRADVFGGTVDHGRTELRYQGLDSGQRPVFRLTEIETYSNETTMSRYGATTSTFNATQVGAHTSGSVTTYPAAYGYTESLPPNTTQFALDPEKAMKLSIADVEVEILAADEVSVTYRLLSSK